MTPFRGFRSWTVIALLLLLALPGYRPSAGREPQRKASRKQPVAARHQTSARQRLAVLAPTCYKPGTNPAQIPLEFKVSGYQWPQPNGLGSPITITYSYSNLLDGRIHGLTRNQIKSAVEESLSVWASVVPLNFVEVEDSGPLPDANDTEYNGQGRPQIRYGAHVIDGANGPALAHTFLPFSLDSGLAGDVHFDQAEDWSGNDGGLFLETCLHETGHALGMDHEDGVDAIMNSVLMGRFTGLGQAYLLNDDVNGIQSIYGEGIGSVTPLPDNNGGGDGGGETGGTPSDSTDNDVLAEIDGATGDLVLTGDAAANSVMVWYTRCAVVVLGGRSTTINGGPGAVFRRPVGNITCQLGDGNDLLFVVGSAAGRLDCDLGAGDDALVTLFGSINELLAMGGSGDDWLITLGTYVGSLVDLDFEHVY